MNPGPLVFLATFFAMAVSWLGFVLMPQLQIGRQGQALIEDSGQLYPSRPSGLAKQGAEVYRANGCFYCHTEQVRAKGFGSDYDRHWGARTGPVQSVAQDYVYASPVMLGSQRVGPDLMNVGLRQTNEVWHLRHLYDPQKTLPGSAMPPYRFLFAKRALLPGHKPAADALPADVAPGYEIVPTDDAKALVAYLLSLHADAPLYEAPPLVVPKPPGATNAPAAGASKTNAAPTVAPTVAPTNAPAK